MTFTGRRGFLKSFTALAAGAALAPQMRAGESEMQSAPAKQRNTSHDPEYMVAAYYFGNYHVDPKNEAAHGPGWTEWRLVQGAKPRFPGHVQPKIPLWGYQDESKPSVFERKIEAARHAGLTSFIFDWYWYNDGPFLQRALENGYLKASNRDDLKFALMWANHDWYDIQPAKLGGHPNLQFPGEVTRETFDHLTDYAVNTYFKVPSYWKIDGCPYFSIYELYRFVKGLGGVRQAAAALRDFRDKTRAAGFPDLHFNAVTWGVQLLPGQTEVTDLKALLAELGVDSTTSYVWIHHAEMNDFPVTQYADIQHAYEHYRDGAYIQLQKPYFPNVSVGWDSSPRACQSDISVKREYPFLSVLQGNTPQAFGHALRSAKAFLDQAGETKHKIVTINSWNEWTEGSYLEPDTETKYGYLDQIRQVFRS